MGRAVRAVPANLAFRPDAIDARGGAIALLPIGEQLMTICGSM
ncbi:hypothetical protein [Burkholderia ubonensis]|nr:hypothetical protein [Burkholderia ubonensis]